jgi:hypothetical protein
MSPDNDVSAGIPGIVAELHDAEDLGGRILARAERMLLLSGVAATLLLVRWVWLPGVEVLRLPSIVVATVLAFGVTRLVMLGLEFHRLRRRVMRLVVELEKTVPRKELEPAAGGRHS